MWKSPALFKVGAAGRRSGKSERAKRWLIRCALAERELADARFLYAAPTNDQAKRIAWRDLKALIPRWAMVARPNESDLSVLLVNGATVGVVGMDRPERVEGPPLDGIVLDEYANMREDAWGAHVRPALETRGRRPGWAWFIGVPEGRNHFWRLHQEASRTPGWDAFWWPSSDILSPEAIAAAKRDLDELTFAQEYEASFVNFSGRAYYPFERAVHAREELRYDPRLPLIFCFDFNVEPGVAVVCQDQLFRKAPGERADRPEVSDLITAVIGEVWIPKNSNTQRVCRKLIADWGKHTLDVRCYGDATGGARGSARVMGSDWDLIRSELRPTFGARLKIRVGDSNPMERPRVNAVNSRLKSVDGLIHTLVCPTKAAHVADDLEGTILLEGGSGELDKDADPLRTHMSDALGYFLIAVYPTAGHSTSIQS